MNLLLIALLGGCTGLRTFTPMAVLCWFAWRGALHFSGWRGFAASVVTVVIFTLLAAGELVGDKLPKTPSRTAAGGLIGRSLFSAFAGLMLAQPLLLSPALAIFVAVVGALIGTFAGWFVRTRSVAALKCPDWPVALTEDAICIGLSITFMHLVAYHSTAFLGNDGLWMTR